MLKSLSIMIKICVIYLILNFQFSMNRQNELQIITEQIDVLTKAKGNNKDKVLAYQHKILQLLLQEKTTRVMNDKLSSQV